MSSFQPGILAPVPLEARYLTLSLRPGSTAVLHQVLRALAVECDGDSLVVGVGAAAVQALGGRIDGLRPFPTLVSCGIEIPATHGALWCWLRGPHRGALVLRSRELLALLAPAFEVAGVVDAFRHDIGRDLSGYEDGTENPEGEEALRAAFVAGRGPGQDGASFVAVQQWRHDLAGFRALGEAECDLVIGRRHCDNEEIDDAPASAHVKRTAQESFDPPAFVLRRSMPWAATAEEGLLFTAFGASLDAYEAQLRRMVGLDDGVVDALFRFSRPLTGGYFWCPPVVAGRGLDLAALGL
jgi:putative iron-dependent peroxidase